MRAIPSILQRLTTDIKGEELGEVLLLAGECYEIINKISQMSLDENYYRSCVRRAQRMLAARKCFANLKNLIQVSFSGSSGAHIPRDIQEELERLKVQSV